MERVEAKKRGTKAQALPWVNRMLLGFLILLLILVPPLGGKYWTWLVSNVLLLGLFAMGFNLLFGYTGLLSFGHAGFFAVGAYVCGKLLLAGYSLLPGLIAGVLGAGVAAVIIGFLCIRHTRIYFAMLTLAFGMMIHSIIWKWRSVTGGDDGLTGVPRPPLALPGVFHLDVSNLSRFYYVILVLTLLGLYLLWRIVHSPLGLTFQGIRDNETRVAFAGLPVRRYRLISFTISGLYAGLAGALMAPLTSSASPNMAHWTFSADPVLATLLGGAQTFAGPLVGAFLLYIIKDYIVRFTEYWLLVLGIIVVALTLGFRGGVVSAVQNVIVPRLMQQGQPEGRR